MKFKFIEQKVIVSKLKNVIDIDFEKLLKIVAGKDFDLNNLSEDDRDDIISEFESSNQNYYLHKAIGIEFNDIYDNENGYSIDVNMKEIQKMNEKFAEFVYNYKNKK